jgi:hypothetical protein
MERLPATFPQRNGGYQQMYVRLVMQVAVRTNLDFLVCFRTGERKGQALWKAQSSLQSTQA